MDDPHACSLDPQRHDAYVNLLAPLIADAFTNGRFILSEQWDRGRWLFERAEVITFDGQVVVLHRNSDEWLYWTDFFTVKTETETPRWQTALTRRVEFYAEKKQDPKKHTPQLVLPRPTHRVESDAEPGYRTNVRFPNPAACGFGRGYYDENSCPVWDDPRG